MITIFTKYLPATNTKGSRMKTATLNNMAGVMEADGITRKYFSFGHLKRLSINW